MDTLCHVAYWRWADQWSLIAVYQGTQGVLYGRDPAGIRGLDHSGWAVGG